VSTEHSLTFRIRTVVISQGGRKLVITSVHVMLP